MRVVAALFLLAACDRVWDLEGREPPDAPDAPEVDAKTCDPGTPFGPGTAVRIDGAYSVEAARFDPTQSIAYLSLCTGAKSTCDLFQSAFSRATGEFSFYSRLNVSDSTVYDSYASITPDAQTLVFGSQRLTGAVRPWVSAAVGGQFTLAAELKVIPDVSYANEPYLVGGGQVLYLAGAKIGGTTSADIYRARGGPPGFGGASDLVDGVNSSGGEYASVVSEDELEIFFASDRESTGVPATMPIDIFGATRALASGPFVTPVKLAALSTLDGSDWPVWLSPDGCDLYYINKVANFATLKVAHR